MLSLQVWRAIRLVLDTGIHSKRWTREQAIAYFRANSSVAETDIAREVDRYFKWPGQATSYMVGQLKIAELRERAEHELGSRFDLRDVHEAVLIEGALPLDVLEEQVDDSRRGRASSRAREGPYVYTSEDADALTKKNTRATKQGDTK